MSEQGTERLRCLGNTDTTYFKSSLSLVKRMSGKEDVQKKERAAKNRIMLDVGLDSDDLGYLENYFGYQVEARAGFALVSSAFVDSFAKCMYKRVMDCKSWSGEEVVLLDGDVKQTVVRMAEWLHVCRFHNSPTDVSRYYDEDRFVSRTRNSKVELMARYAEEIDSQLAAGGGRNVCNKGQLCDHPADVVIVQPGYFQPGAQSIAMMMSRHAAARCKGWFFFDLDMLHKEYGTLLDGRVRYFVDRSRGTVSIFAANSSIPFYIYKMVDMLSIINNRMFNYEGTDYIIELDGADPDVIRYIIVKSDTAPLDKETSYIPLWFGRKRNEQPMVIMSFYTHVPGNPEVGPQRVTVCANKELVEKSISRLIAKKDMSATLNDARQAVADMSDQYIELGAFVRLPNTINGVLKEYIARGVYRRARMEKLRIILTQSVVNNAFEQVTENLRGSYMSGLLTLLDRTGAMFSQLVKEPINIVLDAARSDNWDVSITDVDPLVMLKKEWDPAVRGESPLGTVPYEMFNKPTHQPPAIVKQAWAWYQSQKASASKSASVAVETDKEVIRRVPVSKLGADREGLVSELVVAYDATTKLRLGERTTELVTTGQPQMTPAVGISDPFTVMQEEYDQNFPGLAECDFAVRPYLAATSDREYSNVAAALKAKPAEDPPRDMRIHTTILKCGVSGPRPKMMFETGLAFGKRVGGAPDFQHPRDYERMLKETFDKFQQACFKPGWQEAVKNRVAEGLWMPRDTSVRDVVSKMKPSVVSRAISEEFRISDILMNEYDAMVKSQPKDKLDSATAFEHTASQTIMYQPNKRTNAYFSSILGEVHDLLDDILIPGVLINARRDKKYAEQVWNATRNRRNTAAKLQKIDVDISQCDKSQSAFNLCSYFYVMEQLGMPPDIRKFFEQVMEKKVASSRDHGLRIWYFYQVVSGLFSTISMNSINVAMATVNAFDLGPGQLVNMLVSGDDVLLVVNIVKNLQMAADAYAAIFNFEVKVFEPEALYWCGRYLVEIDDYTLFVKDPERIYSALARYQLEGYDPVESFEAFKDDTEAYEWEEAIVGVADCVQRRNKRRVAPIGTCRGISTLRRSVTLFESRMGDIRVLSM